MGGLLDGQSGIVTGAGRGLGRTTALLAAAEGASLVLCDRDEEGGEETARLVLEAGGRAVFTKADVREDDQVSSMVERAVGEHGRLDFAVNNAAAGAFYAATADLPREQWDLTLAVTLTGVWTCMKHEIRAMLGSGGGSIVNVSSASGIKGEALLSAYSAAKGGVNTLTKTAAAEYATRGIRVNAVCPGGIRTPAIEHYFEHMPEIRDATVGAHAMNRLAEPEEIAEAILWLASARSSFVTGHLLLADGGIMVRSHLPPDRSAEHG